jgi:pimeloyl-ACP methyl ester carboxylesterase
VKLWVRPETEKLSCAAWRRVEQQRQQRAVLESQQQHAIERQQQYWVSVREGDSRGSRHAGFSGRNMAVYGPSWRPSRKPTGCSLFPVVVQRGTNKPKARGLVAAAKTAANVPARFLAMAFLCLMLGILSVRAEVGVGFSSLFTIDTRYGFSEGAAVSSRFILDTRLSGSWHEAVSGNFVVDTRGGVPGNSSISGWVISRSGAPLAGVSVEAIQAGVLRASALTDSSGNYRLPLLPAGIYDLRARKGDWLTGHHFGLSLAPGQSVQRHFALEPRPAAPVVQTTARGLEAAQTPALPIPSGDQLRRFVNGRFERNQVLNPNKMTIVLTHGWTGDADDWPTDMARDLLASGIDPELNILAWDWRGEASGVLKLFEVSRRTLAQGEALGRMLHSALGEDYSRPIHFIGFSMGTLVHAAAANYLHGDAPQSKPSKPWSPERTHVTVLDEAEIAADLARFTAATPIPHRAVWVDNYYTIYCLDCGMDDNSGAVVAQVS